MKAGAIVISVDVVRRKFDCPVEVREGRVEVAFFLECHSAIKVWTAPHVIRKDFVDLYCLSKISNGPIQVSVAHLLVAALVEGIDSRSLCWVRIALYLRFRGKARRD